MYLNPNGYYISPGEYYFPPQLFYLTELEKKTILNRDKSSCLLSIVLQTIDKYVEEKQTYFQHSFGLVYDKERQITPQFYIPDHSWRNKEISKEKLFKILKENLSRHEQKNPENCFRILFLGCGKKSMELYDHNHNFASLSPEIKVDFLDCDEEIEPDICLNFGFKKETDYYRYDTIILECLTYPYGSKWLPRHLKRSSGKKSVFLGSSGFKLSHWTLENWKFALQYAGFNKIQFSHDYFYCLAYKGNSLDEVSRKNISEFYKNEAKYNVSLDDKLIFFLKQKKVLLPPYNLY